MKNRASLLILFLCASLTTSVSYADGLSDHFGNSVTYSVEAIAQGSMGSAKLASGIAAAPFGMVGALGEVSDAVYDELSGFANSPAGGGLIITDETITSLRTPTEALLEEKESP